jgi:hypothetical protein
MSPGAHKRTPPSAHAIHCLARIARSPLPACEINPGVRDKLQVFGYAELYQAPSPYKTHKAAQTVAFIRATEAGRAALTAVE